VVAAETPSSNAGRNSVTWPQNFAYQHLSYLKGYLTCCTILRHWADGFTTRPKEVVLRTSVSLKNPSLSAGFEHSNLGSSGKHDKITPPRTTSCPFNNTLLPETFRVSNIRSVSPKI
jgi:hypothetical protein